MNDYWNSWNIGGKIIFASTCVAVVSMLFNWVDVGFISQSGLTQGAFFFLILWIYPALMLYKNKAINRSAGLVCSIASLLITIAYIGSKSGDLFGKTFNAASTGAWLFLFTSIALTIGIIKYIPAAELTDETPVDE